METPVLQPIGVSEVEETVYRSLLRRPRSTLADLHTMTLIGHRQLRAALAALQAHGLAARAPGRTVRFVPTPPDIGIEALVLRRLEEVERVRGVARQLAADFREAQQTVNPLEMVEIVTGTDAIAATFDQLQRNAGDEVLILDRPPYTQQRLVNQPEIEAISRHVTYRVIYSRAGIDSRPGRLEQVVAASAMGQRSRFCSELPLKLAIFDRRAALIPVAANPRMIDRAILVHEGPLLDALIYVFESLWDAALPVPFPDERGRGDETGEGERTAPHDGRLLMLLAMGLKDEAIAHQLGVSHRTTRRRIADLLHSLGVETRFQAGVHLARQGWL